MLPISLFCLLFGLIFPFYFEADLVAIIINSIILIPISVFGLWCWFGTSYLINEEQLVIKQGPFQKTMNINEIEFIEKNSHPLLASAALTFDSYVIQYKPYKTIIIAPENMDDFIEVLKSRSRDHIINIKEM
ncbi:PH domain-containing protein [Alkalihalobacillus sp. NPDC078783]